MNICLQCGNAAKKKFCSRSCAGTFNNKFSPKRKIERICSYPDCTSLAKNYKTRRCAYHIRSNIEQYSASTLGEYRNKLSVAGKHSSWTTAHIRTFNRRWNNDYTLLPCANCGYSKHVELCHIKDVKLFTNDNTLAEINHRENIIQLCRNCHWEMGENLIFLNMTTRSEIIASKELATPEGLEPPTLPVETVRSNPLSYGAITDDTTI